MKKKKLKPNSAKPKTNRKEEKPQQKMNFHENYKSNKLENP